MQRPDPIISRKPGAEDVLAERNKAAWLEELFFLDGRDRKDHPQCGLFTGLAEQYRTLQSTDGY